MPRKPPSNPLDYNAPETVRWLAADRADHFEKLCSERRIEVSEAIEELKEMERLVQEARRRLTELRETLSEFESKSAHLRAVENSEDATFEMLMKEP